jgi:hypothetical protein
MLGRSVVVDGVRIHNESSIRDVCNYPSKLIRIDLLHEYYRGDKIGAPSGIAHARLTIIVWRLSLASPPADSAS